MVDADGVWTNVERIGHEPVLPTVLISRLDILVLVGFYAHLNHESARASLTCLIGYYFRGRFSTSLSTNDVAYPFAVIGFGAQ